MLKAWAKPSFSRLTTRLISPCVHRVTALDLWRPARRKPRPASRPSNFGALVSSTANSMNAAPRQLGQVRQRAPRLGSELVQEVTQRPVPVDGDAAGGARPELIVEDLKRQ